MKEISLWYSINKVIEDKEATNEEKLERIEIYLEVYKSNNKQSMSDMV